ncbi:nitrate reductase molybdenum cofactor assembly chaperone NarJ [Salmonella enterica subsp. enterica]|uniref:Nitrate reductase molybdenum cofactor assembly chaperone NarJ n=7 Tax=Salmonella enterica TaxID=28901 RepID=A0A447U319_SALET|nr:nitrate reductase molybdenum cofactor assembly chaperone NarJ [Salmonella enterica subsp. enterica]
MPHNGNILPAVETLRIPVQYLANMLSAGDTGPVIRALKRMMAMRHYMRSQTVEGVTDTRAIEEVGLSIQQVEEMYRYLAIANYEDRFVIPTSHREMARDAFPERNGCGFTFGDGCHGSDTKFNLFNSSRIDAINITEVRDKAEGGIMQILKAIGLLMEYPDDELWECRDEALALIQHDAPMLADFTRELLYAPLLDKQAEWCEVFDRGRATSLLLFEHVHAESRDRGQAMVDLLSQYETVGLQLNCRELPDHLPLYLEYLSVLPEAEAREGLQNIAPILALLGGRLKQRGAPWYQLFDALLTLAGSTLTSDSVTKKIIQESRDDTRQALDAVWEEEQVKFIEDNATTCDSSPLHHYQRRFSQDAAPQYVDVSAGGPK